MIIFWKFLFEEDLLSYEKDPTAPVNNASEIAPYTPSAGDKAVNYFLGIFFIFPWIISTSLNPLLFWYFRTTKTKTTTLFKWLAVTDLLTDLWCPLVYTYFMLSSELFPSSHSALSYTRTWTCVIGCFSQIIGVLLAVSRAIMIVFPYYNLKQRYVLIYLGGYIAYMTINNGTYFVINEFFEKDEWAMKLLKIGIDSCFWVNLVHCCAGVLVSVFTFIYLYHTSRKNPGNDNTKYIASCITILLINVPYLITVITFILVRWVTTNQINFQEINFAWVPIVTSAINPIVIMARNSAARKAVPGIIRGSGLVGFRKRRGGGTTLGLANTRNLGV